MSDWLTLELDTVCKKLRLCRGLNSYGVLLPLSNLRTQLDEKGKQTHNIDEEGTEGARAIVGPFVASVCSSMANSSGQWTFVLATGLSQIGDSRVPQSASQIATELFSVVEIALATVMQSLDSVPIPQAAQDIVQGCCSAFEIFFGPITKKGTTQISKDPLLAVIAGESDDDDGEDDRPVQLFSELLHDYSEEVLLSSLSTVAAITQALAALEELVAHQSLVSTEHQELSRRVADTFDHCLTELKANNIISQVTLLLTKHAEAISKSKGLKGKEQGSAGTQDGGLSNKSQPSKEVPPPHRGALSGFHFLFNDDDDGDDEDTYGVRLVHPPTSAGGVHGVASRPPSGANIGRPGTSSSRPTSSLPSAGSKRVAIATYGEKAAQLVALGLQVVAWAQQRVLSYLNHRIGDSKTTQLTVTAAEEIVVSCLNPSQMRKLREALCTLLVHCVGLQSAATRNLVGSSSAANRNMSAAKLRAHKASTYTSTALTYTAKLVIPILFVLRYIVAVQRQQHELDGLIGPSVSADPTSNFGSMAVAPARGVSQFDSTPTASLLWLRDLLENALLAALNRYCMQLLMLLKGTWGSLWVDEESTTAGNRSTLRSRKHQVMLLLHTTEQLCVAVDEVLECAIHVSETSATKSTTNFKLDSCEEIFSSEYLLYILQKLLNVQPPSSPATAQPSTADESPTSEAPSPSARLLARNIRPFTPPASIVANVSITTSDGRDSPTAAPSSPNVSTPMHFILALLTLRGAISGLPEELSLTSHDRKGLAVDMSTVVLGRFLSKISFCIWTHVVLPVLSGLGGPKRTKGVPLSCTSALTEALSDAVNCSALRCNFLVDFALCRLPNGSFIGTLAPMMLAPQDLIRALALWVLDGHVNCFIPEDQPNSISRLLGATYNDIMSICDRQNQIYRLLCESGGYYSLAGAEDTSQSPSATSPIAATISELLFAVTHFIGDNGLVLYNQLFAEKKAETDGDESYEHHHDREPTTNKVLRSIPDLDKGTLMGLTLRHCELCVPAILVSLMQLCEEIGDGDDELEAVTTVHQRVNAELILEIMIGLNSHCLTFLAELLNGSFDHEQWKGASSDNDKSAASSSTEPTVPKGSVPDIICGRARPPRRDYFAATATSNHSAFSSRSASANNVSTTASHFKNILSASHTPRSAAEPSSPRGSQTVQFKVASAGLILSALEDEDDVHDLHILATPLLNAILQLSQQITAPPADGVTWWTSVGRSIVNVMANTSDLPLVVVSLYTLYNLLDTMVVKSYDDVQSTTRFTGARSVAKQLTQLHSVWQILARVISGAITSVDLDEGQRLEVSTAVCLVAERLVLILRGPASDADVVNAEFMAALVSNVAAILKLPALTESPPPRAISLLLLFLEEDAQREAIKATNFGTMLVLQQLAEVGSGPSPPSPSADAAEGTLPAPYIRLQAQFQHSAATPFQQQWVYVRCQALKYLSD